VNRQFSRRLELEDHCYGERLRGASHLVKRVLVDGSCVGVAAYLPGEGLDRRPSSAEADIGGDAGDLFDRRPRRKPRVNCSLNSLDLGRLGSRNGCRKDRHDRSGQNRNNPVLHGAPFKRNKLFTGPPTGLARSENPSWTASPQVAPVGSEPLSNFDSTNVTKKAIRGRLPRALAMSTPWFDCKFSGRRSPMRLGPRNPATCRIGAGECWPPHPECGCLFVARTRPWGMSAFPPVMRAKRASAGAYRATRTMRTRFSARWILFLLWPPRPWGISSLRLAEPFPWPALRPPSAVSDHSRQLEASSPVRPFPSSYLPPSSGERARPQYSRSK